MSQTYILAAPNGARRGHADHAALPVTLDEITATAGACFAAGAQGLHLHVRDDDGQHSLDAGRYTEALAELSRAVPKMDLQITTESAGKFDVPDQLACLRAVQPGWASISVREVARAPDLADTLYGTCAAQGTRVQHILYGAEDASLLARWKAEGVVRPEQVERIFVLGRYTTGQVSTPADLDVFTASGLPNSPWMVCAFGSQEHACLAAAAAMGGQVRVGFENSLTDENGSAWKDNAASVAALVTRLEGART
ncbi:3-keto-5-aminohexanoate cleavage protein [Fluviibacterium sp. DFM31]|uniref:3-keto-5-aminohexanoate cleavage protein n=1 Tax=Meridianimarinicoccus marinus TaxID=3231483 RepID=A0ABV3L9D6_9RHOB